MTDGIIQEVFRNFMDRNNYDIRDMVIHFPELQKELIEKINSMKINYSKMYWSAYSDGVNATIEKLIGDRIE